MQPVSPLDALKTLHDAVLRHGLTEGDGDAWLIAFQGLMDAMKQASVVIAAAEGPADVAGLA